MTEPREQSLVVDQWGKVDLVHYQFQASKLQGQALRQFSLWLWAMLTKAVTALVKRARARAKSAPRGVVWGFIQAASSRGPRQA